MRICKSHLVACLIPLLGASLSAQAADRAIETPTEGICSPGMQKDAGNRHFCNARVLWLAGDYAKAEPELLRAARMGNAPAQHALGLAYFNGDGLAANRPLGLAWLAMSSSSQDEEYLGIFKSAYDNASSEEKAQANQQLDRLQRRYKATLARAEWSNACNRTPRESHVAGCGRSDNPIPLSVSERMGPAPTQATATQSRQ